MMQWMPRWRPRRKIVWIPIATVGALVGLAIVLQSTGLVVSTVAGGKGASNAPTIPACNARTLSEGFTYHFRDPHRGEIVVIHARGQVGSPITPDPQARDLNLTKRVIGVPGDTVVGRDGRVFVNGRKPDDIATAPFPPTHLGAKQYFVLGDNRSAAQDSRAFGPVPRDAIFGRVFLIYWPLGRFGTPGYEKTLVPPGEVIC
jgi:signal peptidase I